MDSSDSVDNDERGVCDGALDAAAAVAAHAGSSGKEVATLDSSSNCSLSPLKPLLRTFE